MTVYGFYGFYGFEGEPGRSAKGGRAGQGAHLPANQLRAPARDESRGFGGGRCRWSCAAVVNKAAKPNQAQAGER
jgi:hypothetical protein